MILGVPILKHFRVSHQLLLASDKSLSTLIRYNFSDFIHVCGHGAGADNPLKVKNGSTQEALITSIISCTFQKNLFNLNLCKGR